MGDRNTFPPEVANDINEALAELQNIDGNTDDVEAKLDSVIGELQDIEVDVESVDLNTDELEAKLDDVNSELDTINTNTDEVETKLDSVISELQDIDANTDTVESELQDVNTELDSIDSLLDELEDALTSVGTDQIRVDIIGEGDLATEATLSSVDGFLDELEDALASVGTDELRVNVASISGDIATETTLAEILNRLQGGSTQTDSLESSVATTLDRLRLYNGQFYEHSVLFDNFKDGESKFYFINNPVGSGVLVDIGTITVESDGKANITTSFNVTVDSAGTQQDPRNKDADMTDTEVFEIFIGGTYSGGEDELTFTLPGGVGETAIGTNASTEVNLLRPGNNMLIEVFNNSGRSEDVSIQSEMAEVPE